MRNLLAAFIVAVMVGIIVFGLIQDPVDLVHVDAALSGASVVLKSDRLLAPNNASVISKTGRDMQLSKFVVARRSGNLFVVSGTIGEQTLLFIVDTGASQVCLTFEAGARIKGLSRTGAFQSVLASGTQISVMGVIIPELRVGAIVLQNIQGCVFPQMPNGGVGINLLGQTFLERIRFWYEKDFLVLNQ